MLARERILQLNKEQKAIFNIIINSVEQVQPQVFFSQVPAGTRKTHL